MFLFLFSRIVLFVCFGVVSAVSRASPRVGPVYVQNQPARVEAALMMTCALTLQWAEERGSVR